VHPTILWTVVGTSLLAATLGLVTSLLNRPPGRAVLAGAAVAELAALVQSVVAGVQLARGHDVHSAATFVGYLLGNLAVIPVAVFWSLAERTRWSGAVVAVGGFAVAVMTARLNMMWQGRA
jgi:hypothetical protein